MIYRYIIKTTTNINNKIDQLINKINNDLDIVPNLLGATINMDQILSIEFDNALDDIQILILSKLVSVNIDEKIPKESQIVDYDYLYRSSFESNIDPLTSHDISHFYVPGSIVVNKNENKGYICIKNDLDNAVWKKMDCPEIVKNIDDTISISLEGNTYNTVSIPPISTGKYVLEVDTNETKWKIQDMGPTGPIGETGPTGATGPTGPTGRRGGMPYIFYNSGGNLAAETSYLTFGGQQNAAINASILVGDDSTIDGLMIRLSAAPDGPEGTSRTFEILVNEFSVGSVEITGASTTAFVPLAIPVFTGDLIVLCQRSNLAPVTSTGIATISFS